MCLFSVVQRTRVMIAIVDTKKKVFRGLPPIPPSFVVATLFWLQSCELIVATSSPMVKYEEAYALFDVIITHARCREPQRYPSLEARQ